MYQNQNQPRALVGNSVSDAYFNALRQRPGAKSLRCAHCGEDLSSSHRMSDGDLTWCGAGHHELWLRGKRDAAMRRELVARGWKEPQP